MKGKKKNSAHWAFRTPEWEDGDVRLSDKELRKWWKLNKHTTYNPEKFGMQATNHSGGMYRSLLYKKYFAPMFALGGK